MVRIEALDFLNRQDPTTRIPALELRLYKSGMPLQVDAVYENGVLRAGCGAEYGALPISFGG